MGISRENIEDKIGMGETKKEPGVILTGEGEDEGIFLSPDEMFSLARGSKITSAALPEKSFDKKVLPLSDLSSETSGAESSGDEILAPRKDRLIEKIGVVTPGSLVEEEEEVAVKQLDLKPLLKKKDIASFMDILSPDEMETEEEFVSRALPAGTVIGERFEILKTAEEKSFQITYVVKDKNEAGKKYCLKEIIPRQMDKEEYRARRERFRDIVRLLSSSKYQDLAQVYESFTENGREYCLIENIDGLDLRKLSQMATDPFGEKLVIKIGEQICDAVDFLHYRPQPFTLGNLAPENIVMDGEGRPNITDYDFRRFFDPGRTIDFLPDNPKKLYDEITKIARVFFFLLTKEDYEKQASDFKWPAAVSAKMRKLLEIACSDGQKTYGDIKEFKKVFLETQIEESQEVDFLRKTYNFPKIKIEFTWLKSVYRYIVGQSLPAIAIELLLIAFVVFILVANPFKEKAYIRPVGVPIAFVFTGNQLYTVNADNFEILNVKPLGFASDDSLLLNLDIESAAGKREPKEVLVACDTSGGGIVLIDPQNNSVISRISAGAAPYRILTREGLDYLLVFHRADSRIALFDKKNLTPLKLIKLKSVPVCALLAEDMKESKSKKGTKGSVGLIVALKDKKKMVLLDPLRGKEIRSVKIDFEPVSMLFFPENKTIFCLTDEDSHLIGMDWEKGVVSSRFPLPHKLQKPSDMVYDRDNKLIWICFSGTNSIVSFNPATGEFGKPIAAGIKPVKMLVRDGKKQLWVFCQGTKETIIKNSSDGGTIGKIDLGEGPLNVTIVEKFGEEGNN